MRSSNNSSKLNNFPSHSARFAVRKSPKGFFTARFFIDLAILCCFLFAGYYFRTDIIRFFRTEQRYFVPCSLPIKYNIGQFDTRFDLTKAQFLADISKSENLWESAVHKQLFEYSTSSPEMTINLIYDYRQIATDKLQQLSTAIDQSKNGEYKALNDKYNSLQSSYKSQKSELAVLISQYQSAQADYESQVSYWNARGGAPKAEYATLQRKKTDLSNQYGVITQKQANLNQLGSQVNAVVDQLNAVAKKLNMTIQTYNSVSDSTGETFDEGRYISNRSGQSINIYQFENETKLIRVLAHELGHAIGLDHIDNSKAIMYKLNEGNNGSLTADDIAALKNVCRIK